MTNEAAKRTAIRKAELLIDGANYRTGLVQSRTAVSHALRPESLIRSALENTVGIAGAQMVTSLLPTGTRFRSLMPFAVAGVSTLMQQKLRHVLFAATLVAVTATVFTALRKRHGTITRKQPGH